MPTALARACPFCGSATVGRCPCRPVRQPDVHRGSSHERGYTKSRWRPARDAHLRKYPLCGQRPGGVPPVMSRCYDEGRVTAATVVDHQEPHRGDMKKFWNRSNWASMCASCHSRKSASGL
jgi:5-methylcytosine-specific restriction protein A